MSPQHRSKIDTYIDKAHSRMLDSRERLIPLSWSTTTTTLLASVMDIPLHIDKRDNAIEYKSSRLSNHCRGLVAAGSDADEVGCVTDLTMDQPIPSGLCSVESRSLLHCLQF